MIPSIILHHQSDHLLLWYPCEALQLGALQVPLSAVAAVVQRRTVTVEVSLLTGNALLHLVQEQAATISEMGVVVEVNTQVGYLDHMVVGVAEVEAHTIAEEIMRDRILVMMLLDGIQVTRMGTMVGETLQGVVEAAAGVAEVVAVAGVVVVAVAGVVGLLPMMVMAGVVELLMADDGAPQVEGMLLLPPLGTLAGVVTLKEVQVSLKVAMGGLAVVVVVGEANKFPLLKAAFQLHGCSETKRHVCNVGTAGASGL